MSSFYISLPLGNSWVIGEGRNTTLYLLRTIFDLNEAAECADLLSFESSVCRFGGLLEQHQGLTRTP